MQKWIRAACAASVLSMSLTAGFAAAPIGIASAASIGTTAAQTSPQKFNGHPGRLRDMHCGHGMSALSKVTGKTESELAAQFPQQTAWQIAYKLGKLDALKKEVLAQHKEMLDRMEADKKITAQEAANRLADFQKRVGAIDGKNTVILGHGHMPR